MREAKAKYSLLRATATCARIYLGDLHHGKRSERKKVALVATGRNAVVVRVVFHC